MKNTFFLLLLIGYSPIFSQTTIVVGDTVVLTTRYHETLKVNGDTLWRTKAGTFNVVDKTKETILVSIVVNGDFSDCDVFVDGKQVPLNTTSTTHFKEFYAKRGEHKIRLENKRKEWVEGLFFVEPNRFGNKCVIPFSNGKN